jgi:hypothetical protein
MSSFLLVVMQPFQLPRAVLDRVAKIFVTHRA